MVYYTMHKINYYLWYFFTRKCHQKENCTWCKINNANSAEFSRAHHPREHSTAFTGVDVYIYERSHSK